MQTIGGLIYVFVLSTGLLLPIWGPFFLVQWLTSRLLGPLAVIIIGISAIAFLGWQMMVSVGACDEDSYGISPCDGLTGALAYHFPTLLGPLMILYAVSISALCVWTAKKGNH
jgi:hypothetical protein